MGLILLVGAQSGGVLYALLLAVLGLTYWECRDQQLEAKMIGWWLSFVFLAHFPAYLALRAYNAYQKRRTSD